MMIDHASALEAAEYKQGYSNLARSYLNYASRLTALEDAAENALECLAGCVLPAGGCDDEKTIADAVQMLRSALVKATTQEG